MRVQRDPKKTDVTRRQAGKERFLGVKEAKAGTTGLSLTLTEAPAPEDPMKKGQ